MVMFSLLLIIALCRQASPASQPRPQLLVVSGTNNQTDQSDQRDFDGVYEAAQNASEFYGGKDNVTVYKRIFPDEDSDIHIIGKLSWKKTVKKGDIVPFWRPPPP